MADATTEKSEDEKPYCELCAGTNDVQKVGDSQYIMMCADCRKEPA